MLFSAVYGWYIDFNVGLVFAEYTAASIFFVVIAFYAFYQQRITWLDAVGLSLVFIATFEISIGGEYEREKEDEPEAGPDGEPIDHTEEHKDLFIQAALVIIAGMIQACVALQAKYVEQNKKKMK